MKDIIIVRPDRCKGCNACVRVCPAPEANVTMKMDNGRMMRNKEMPDAFIANSSNLSPRLPNVIKDASKMAKGKAIGNMVNEA